MLYLAKETRGNVLIWAPSARAFPSACRNRWLPLKLYINEHWTYYATETLTRDRTMELRMILLY